MRQNDHNSRPTSRRHAAAVALCCLVLLICSGCTSEYIPGETSKEKDQRLMKEAQDMNNYILKPGFYFTFH